MPVRWRRAPGWFRPDPRAILPLDGFHASRSLRRSRPRFDVTVDRAFREVVTECGDPRRPNGWITHAFVDAYVALNRIGAAHSVECWREGVLVGGVYGVAIGSFFAGESMFHRVTDASKVALWHLVELLSCTPDGLLDVQWTTPHLASLGVVEISADRYQKLLDRAVQGPDPWTTVTDA